jgi:hypothetical protein
MKQLVDQQDIDKVIVWSLNNPNPMIFRNKNYSTNLVCWAGCLMTEPMALIVASMFAKIHIGQKAKMICFDETVKLMSCGAFGENSERWKKMILARQGSTHNFYERVVRGNLSKLGVHTISPECAKHWLQTLILNGLN